MELNIVEMGDWTGIQVKEPEDTGEHQLRVLQQLHDLGMSHSPRKDLNLAELWEGGAWDDDVFVETVLHFVRERHERLTRHNSTPAAAIKASVDNLTCPFTISPEAMKFGQQIADFGEPITIGLLMIQTGDVVGLIAEPKNKNVSTVLTAGHA